MDTELTINYIAGFFDGEGCVSLVKTHTRSDRRMKSGFELTPSIVIVQKKRTILEMIYNFLQNGEIGCYLYNTDLGKINRLKVTGIKRVKKFCEVFIPYSITKKEELIILLEYCDYRLSKSHFETYSEKELEFYLKLQQLKKS